MMEVNASSIVLGIAVFALLSMGIANATSLTITSNSITTSIDYPQNAIYTINGISGGVLPYTFNAYYTNANVPATNVFLGSNTFSPGTSNAIILTINSVSQNSISITAYNGIASTANTLFSNSISTGTNTIYGAWTFNAFFADSTGTNTISSSNTLTIDPTPTATSLTPSNTILDLGQYETYSVAISGGTGKFNANLIYVSGPSGATVNSVLPGNVVESLTGQSSGTLTFPSFNSFSTNGLYTFNVIATDTGTTTPYVFSSASNTITVNPALSTPLTPIAVAEVDQGQGAASEDFGRAPLGGSGPVTYTWLVSYNSGAYAPATSTQCVTPSGTASSGFAETCSTTASTPPGTYTYKIQFKDSATTPENTTSSPSGTATVNTAPTATSLTPSNTAPYYGQQETYNVIISGGTLPIAASLVYVTGLSSNNVINGNVPGNVLQTVTLPVGSAEPNIITFNSFEFPSAGSYTFNVVATDSANTSVTFHAVANTIIVGKNATLTATSTSHPATVYVSQPVSITFTGTPTINNQSAWSLYVNGVLYGNPAASKITWSEHAYPPGTYSFVFSNSGNANYDSNSITTTLNIIYQPTGGVTPPPPTTTVTTTIPTTIPQTTLTIIENVSASAPVVINYSIAKALISIKTPSTVPVPVKAFVANITSTAPLAPTGFDMVSALNISINTTANVSISVTQGYPCNENASLIAPYLFENGTWVAITPFAVNATACTVTYPIQKDPIVGILEKIPATTTVSTTTVPITTVPKTTIIPTTTIPSVVTPAPNYGLEIAVVVIVVVIIVVILYYYMSKGSKHRR